MTKQPTEEWTEEDMHEARRVNGIKSDLACLEGKLYSDRWFATNQLYNLADLAENGLPCCYESINDFWYDFWPDFSWNEKEQRNQVRILLEDSRYNAIRSVLDEVHDIDLDRILRSVFEQREPNDHSDVVL